MIYAQIKKTYVVNIIELKSEKDLEIFKGQFDYIIDVSKNDPLPGIGWTYENKVFSPPPADTSQEDRNAVETERLLKVDELKKLDTAKFQDQEIAAAFEILKAAIK
jgi:hypothetical protein